MSQTANTLVDRNQPNEERLVRRAPESHNQWVIDKLEKTRRIALLLIRNVDALEVTDALVLVQLHRLQAEIARLKSDYGIRIASPNAWVDEWRAGSSAVAA